MEIKLLIVDANNPCDASNPMLRYTKPRETN